MLPSEDGLFADALAAFAEIVAEDGAAGVERREVEMDATVNPSVFRRHPSGTTISEISG
jgi:hypothetical protein